MITLVVRRVVPLAALALVLGAVVRTQRVPIVISDTWFHLRFGEEFLSGSWSLRHPGHLGVFDTADWIPTQWLPQIGMAWLDDHLGIAGVVFAGGFVQLLIAVALYLSCRRAAAPLPAAMATALAMFGASPGLSARPQLLSYLLIIATTYAWLRTARDGRARWWVVALAWVWPMLHGMWPIGISISVVAVVGIALQGDVRGRPLLRLAAIPVLSLVVAALNPLGPAVVRSVFDVGSRSAYFSEWGPTDFTEPAGALLAVVVALVLLAGLRSDPVPWVPALLALLALAWALFSVRTTPVAALMLAPIVATALQRLVPDTGPLSRPELASVVAILLVTSLALAVVSAKRASEEVVADWVDSRLDALPAGAKVLDDWSAGAYLLAEHPDLELVMHGYGEVFTDDELARNADLVRLEPGWDDLLADLDVDVALLDPDTPLGYAVENQLGWTRVEGDDDFVLLTPPGS
ncbi:hypothetical protein J2X46_002765 [Nocardioides sp. BE266]|uniref:hypothetical protein n=1 Tax=Nocardioides sp. BE266 TaxID=2817725 RepID=UPI0028641680|nr:hypothetical protein [Nocardioides sp. BE266]MDR7253775.1 hypothetical protein [Nocardioides sp. BE266]